MPDFAATLEHWSNFYFALAGIAGTLLGLLFVGVSLSFAVLNQEKYSDLRTIADQAYINYLLLMFSGLSFLLPEQSPASLGLILLALALFGLVASVMQARRMQRHAEHPLAGSYVRWPFLISLISLVSLLAYALLALLALWLAGGQALNLTWFVAPIVLLMVAATQTTWDFLAKRAAIGEHRPGER